MASNGWSGTGSVAGGVGTRHSQSSALGAQGVDVSGSPLLKIVGEPGSGRALSGWSAQGSRYAGPSGGGRGLSTGSAVWVQKWAWRVRSAKQSLGLNPALKLTPTFQRSASCGRVECQVPSKVALACT